MSKPVSMVAILCAVALPFALTSCGIGEPKPPPKKVPAAKTLDAAPKPIKVVPNSPQAKAAIEAAIRKTAGKPTGELTKADLEKMTGRDVLLDIRSKNITDLTPLADLTNLVQFQLGRNQITDLTPLTGLTKLEGFVVGRNPITDLTPLAGSTKLEWLRIAGNPNLTQAEIDKLQKALPKCKITHPF